MSGLASLLNTPLPWKWYYFRARFNAFLANVDPTPAQINGGATSIKGVVACLNAHYRNSASEFDNAILNGGWGKGLWVRPPRDIDVLFVLPFEVYTRFQSRVGNRQSALLQEVKGVLLNKYVNTDVNGDGQAVVVPFAHVNIDVVPAFLLKNGRHWICDSSGGGAYRETDAAAELNALNLADARYNGCARALIRMAKQWQRHCNVDIKSFMLERLVIEYLFTVTTMRIDYQWWDWLIRDFFAYMTTRANGLVTMPGTLTQVALGDAWLSRAQSALGRCAKACDYEENNETLLAGGEWQKVFGDMIPLWVTV
jgi:hypothetical protein